MDIESLVKIITYVVLEVLKNHNANEKEEQSKIKASDDYLGEQSRILTLHDVTDMADECGKLAARHTDRFTPLALDHIRDKKIEVIFSNDTR